MTVQTLSLATVGQTDIVVPAQTISPVVMGAGIGYLFGVLTTKKLMSNNSIIYILLGAIIGSIIFKK